MSNDDTSGCVQSRVVASKRKERASKKSSIGPKQNSGTGRKRERRQKQNRCIEAIQRVSWAGMRELGEKETVFHQLNGGKVSQRGGKPQVGARK